MPQDPRELRTRAIRTFTMTAVLVYAVSAAVLVVPAFFLATGVLAIGADLGWWPGDPEAKGGEQLVGPVVGLVVTLVVLGVAAVAVRELGRRYLMPVRVPILAGSAVLVVGVVAVCVGVVAA